MTWSAGQLEKADSPSCIFANWFAKFNYNSREFDPRRVMCWCSLSLLCVSMRRAISAIFMRAHIHTQSNFHLNQQQPRYNHQQRFIRRRANEMCLVSNSSNNNECARGNDAPQSAQQPTLCQPPTHPPRTHPTEQTALSLVPMGGDNVISRWSDTDQNSLYWRSQSTRVDRNKKFTRGKRCALQSKEMLRERPGIMHEYVCATNKAGGDHDVLLTVTRVDCNIASLAIEHDIWIFLDMCCK